MLDNSNKVILLEDQLAWLEVPVRDEMTLFKSLLALNEYLITVMETMVLKEITMDFVIVHLMH